jgi:hypothetical protein
MASSRFSEHTRHWKQFFPHESFSKIKYGENQHHHHGNYGTTHGARSIDIDSNWKVWSDDRQNFN